MKYIGRKPNLYIESGCPDAFVNPLVYHARWLNKDTGEMFTCVDNSTDANVWVTGDVIVETLKPAIDLPDTYEKTVALASISGTEYPTEGGVLATYKVSKFVGVQTLIPINGDPFQYRYSDTSTSSPKKIAFYPNKASLRGRNAFFSITIDDVLFYYGHPSNLANAVTNDPILVNGDYVSYTELNFEGTDISENIVNNGLGYYEMKVVIGVMSSNYYAEYRDDPAWQLGLFTDFQDVDVAAVADGDNYIDVDLSSGPLEYYANATNMTWSSDDYDLRLTFYTIADTEVGYIRFYGFSGYKCTVSIIEDGETIFSSSAHVGSYSGNVDGSLIISEDRITFTIAASSTHGLDSFDVSIDLSSVAKIKYYAYAKGTYSSSRTTASIWEKNTYKHLDETILVSNASNWSDWQSILIDSSTIDGGTF